MRGYISVLLRQKKVRVQVTGFKPTTTLKFEILSKAAAAQYPAYACWCFVFEAAPTARDGATWCSPSHRVETRERGARPVVRR